MTRLSTQQRKLVYAIVMVALAVPIFILGMPEGSSRGNAAGQRSGGKLAQLRSNYELGETSLGNVDPTSATMNLVLLGLRGVATNVLWMQAVDQKEKKNWGGLRATVDSIILLQPHYRQVWEFQGWNLAYNVSSEWDGISDRFHWVKEGAKFMIKGSERNHKLPELFYETGRIVGEKIGRADEQYLFRQYFLHDPDHPQYNHDVGPSDPLNANVPPDLDLNKDGRDNYLVARDWFLKASDVARLPGVTQHRSDLILFHARPHMQLMNMAAARQKEGKFDETTRKVWEDAFHDWTQVYGQERFRGIFGGTIILEADEETVKELAAADNMSIEQKRQEIDNRQKRVNYPFWRMRAQVESQREMEEARRELYEGKRVYLRQGDFVQGFELIDSGMRKLEAVIGRFPTLKEEETIIEEAVKAVVMWKSIFAIRREPMPETFPLREIWDQNPQKAAEYEDLFRANYGG